VTILAEQSWREVSIVNQTIELVCRFTFTIYGKCFGDAVTIGKILSKKGNPRIFDRISHCGIMSN
jgi:hypothetical protein